PKSLSTLVESERAFARTSVAKGIRESFLLFFADEGINFQPHPVITKEAIKSRPAPATLPPVTLDWRPSYADVSKAGDLGFTTGPYTLIDKGTNPRPPVYGYYFSIWKLQTDGNWKVAVDAGITTPDPVSLDTAFFQAASRLKPAKESSAVNQNTERAALLEIDKELSRKSASADLANSYLSYLSDEVRLYRDGHNPFIGLAAITAFLPQIEGALSCSPIKSDVATSLDLGYTYGSYELKKRGEQSGIVEKGYYVHLWKRASNGSWRLTLDVMRPLPTASN
ncbi:MAG: nuclear transport factor 2 family protein, partial [Acidobacteriota bacterium]